jgi:hypothetical protein
MWDRLSSWLNRPLAGKMSSAATTVGKVALTVGRSSVDSEAERKASGKTSGKVAGDCRRRRPSMQSARPTPTPTISLRRSQRSSMVPASGRTST